MKKVLGVILALFLIVTASLVFSACQEDKEPEGQLPVLQVGDQWVWQYEMEGKSYTLTEEVIGEENVEGRDCYVIEMAFDPVMTSTHEGVVYTTVGMRYWSDKATGLLGVKHEYTTATNELTYTSCMMYSYNPWTSLFPLKVDKEVELEKTATNYFENEQYGEPEVATERYAVVGREDITVAAGTFSCWEITYYDSSSGFTQIMLWSDEVKTMIKSVDQDGNIIMELQSYSVS